MTLPRDDHWSRFWLDETRNLAGRDEQSQVLRVRNRQPIDPARWSDTVAHVAGQLQLASDDVVLDLACGNGLFAAAFAGQVRSVHGVDLSPTLIAALKARGLANVTADAIDVRDARFPSCTFTKIIWYAGIQYLPENDIVDVLRRVRDWLTPGGRLLVGDVPDRRKLWSYFTTPERQAAYFDGLAQRRPLIGTWLEPEWLERLCASVGLHDAVATPQEPPLIYADFRFDLTARG